MFYILINAINFLEVAWEQRKLGSLGILERGKSKHRPRNDPKLFGGEIPFIQTGDISNSNLFLSNYSQTLSDFGLKQSKIWKSGTLVITIAANIADTAITTFDTAFPDSIIGFQSQEVDLIFVKAELDRQSKLIKKKADVGTQANLNLKKLGNLCFMIPNIKEQKLIANLLKNMNYSIAANLRQHSNSSLSIENYSKASINE
ncbi:restriction endonuclease subunit S [Lentilactobacillus hilgardii]|uniref:restriction endonuclease subunit S n=1 Tax=Lentilactobacillus hilgardii TaxID=1588 RepID=UPI0021C2ED18|nr:restriction endonuclease subunit S [Lentilactobacillus hilgardii]